MKPILSMAFDVKRKKDELFNMNSVVGPICFREA